MIPLFREDKDEVCTLLEIAVTIGSPNLHEMYDIVDQGNYAIVNEMTRLNHF